MKQNSERSAGVHVGEGRDLFSPGQGANSAATMETAVEVLQEARKKEINLPYGLPIPLMGICPKDFIYCSKDTCLSLFIMSLFTKARKQTT